MNLFIDDMRDPPEGWDHAKCAEEAIGKLRTNRYNVVSFDHDLGEEMSGYDVMCVVEKDAAAHMYPYKMLIMIHTANASARPKMYLCAQNIHLMLGVKFSPIVWNGFHVPEMPNMWV